MHRVGLSFVAHVSTTFAVAFGVVITLAGVTSASAQPTNLAVTVRHAPSLNGNGRIEGSLQQLLGESATLNGGFTLTGDLLAPGTPTLRINGNPTFAGTLTGTGVPSPTGYQITLNGNCSLRYLRPRTTPASLPTVAAPPQPTGTRAFIINSAGQSIGNPATLRDLTLNGNASQATVPPGTYGTFTANGGSGFIFGVSGAAQPAVYNLQNFNLNGNTRLDIVGPVILTVANGFTANGLVGTTNHSSWLQLQIANGGFTLNGGCTVHGSVTAPAGTVIINGNSCLVGTAQCDRLTVNGGGCIRWAGAGGAANQPPLANNQTLTGAEDTPLNITLTGSDPEGASLTYTLLSQPSHGTLNIQPSTLNQFIYAPATNFNGSDSFKFKVNDGQADSLAATVAITVTALNDAPTALPQNLGTAEDMALAIHLTGTDMENDPLTFQIVSPPAHGILSGTAPDLVYQPTSNYNGPDNFTFKARDGRTNSALATVNITVQAVNDAPVANAQTVTTDEDTPVPVWLNGADVEGYPLTFTVLFPPVHGQLSGSPPALTYTPTTNFNGSDGFTFVVSDGTLTSAVAAVSVVIRPVNDRPAANPQTITVPEDTTTNIVLTGSDADGDALTFTIVSPPVHGTLQGSPPQLNYSPAADYHGADNFTFMVNDGQNNSVSTAVNLVITPVNDPPVAQAAALIINEDTPLTLKLTATDVDGDTLAFVIASPPANGLLTGMPPDLIYQPATNYNGNDSFTFIAKDGLTNSLPAFITITIHPINDAPMADDQSATTDENIPLSLTLNGSDIEGDVLTFSIVDSPAHGTLSGVSPNLIYTPNINFSGPDSFTFKANDGQFDSAVAAVSIGVRKINLPPEDGDFLVRAGPNQIISLPNSASVAGTVEIRTLVIDGQTNVAWSELDGPGEAQFLDPNALATTVQFNKPGTYVLKLRVVYADGTRSDTLVVDVLPPPPHQLSATRSTKGTDFWLTFLANFPPYTEPPYEGCNLYISADTDTAVKVSKFYEGTKQRLKVQAGSSLKVTANFPGDLTASDSIQANAIHVTSDHPVTIHGLNYLTYSTDGYLALPTAMLGTDYIVLAYRNSPSWSDPTDVVGGTEFAIVASEDDTSITIIPSVTTDSRVAGVPYEIILRQGETYRLINRDDPNADLTGTTIKSDKPVAVFGGHICALIPAGISAGDHLVEQLPPVNTWGRHFVTLPLATRRQGDTFRFLAATNSTRLAINGKIVASLNRGECYEQIIAGPAEILANQPILVAQYANGSDFDGTTGDPFMMLIPPFAQFGGDYILSTAQGVVWLGNPPREVYNNNYVNLTVRTNGMGRILLDDNPIPAGCFQLIESNGYAGAQVPVSPGTHHFSAPVPFGVCVYGWAEYESYAFMGGFYSESIEPDIKMDLTQPTPFAAVGQEKTVLARVTNGRGLPIPDLEATFAVSGANTATGKITTSRLGRTVFSYVGTNAGVDVISARLADFSQSVTNTWIAGSDNAPPIVSAANTRIRQYSRTIELAGSVTDDNRPADENFQVQWQLIDGPAQVQVENATQEVTHASCYESGKYEFDFSADDSQFDSHSRVSVLVDDIPEMMAYEIPTVIPAGSPFSIQVDAWDDDGVVDRVEFYANDSLIGTAVSPDWGTSYSINWTPATNGWCQIRAVAFDDLGGSNSLDIGTLQVAYPPQISIDTPGNSAVLTVPTNVSIHATANDLDGTIISVSIYINGNLLVTAGGPDVATTWFPRQPGNYILVALATDSLGLTTASDGVSVTVTGDFPQVMLYPNYTSPFGISFIQLPFGVPFNLRADAWMRGPYRITNVTFYARSVWPVNADPLGSLSEPPYQISWTYQNRAYSSIKVVAEADSGAIGEAELPMCFYRDASVTFTAPGTNKPVAVGTPVTLQLLVKDPGHILETFDYYINGQLLVETNNSDIVFWQPPAPGTYQLQARALDGIEGTCSPFYTGTLSVKAGFAFLNDGVSIVSPNNDDSLYVGSPVSIDLAFEDPTGDFDHAEILTNGVSLGQTTNSCFIWVPQQTNDYVLTARACDHQGNASLPRNPVRIHVLQAPVPVISLRTIPEGKTNELVGFPLLVVADITLVTNVRVSKVELFADDHLVDRATNAPWLFAYVATNPGPHTLTARGTTKPGTVADSQPICLYSRPQLEVMWEGIRSGEWVPVGTNKTLGVRLADPGSVFDHIEFLVNGVVLTNTRFCFTDWEPTAAGNYAFLARAYDRFGNTCQTENIVLHSALLHPPQVSILAPAPSVRFPAGQPIPFIVRATGAGSAVTNLSLFHYSQPEISIAGDTLEHLWTNLPAGEHEFSAMATDDKGLMGESKVRVVIDAPLSTELSPPQNLAALALGCNAIQITWNTNSATAANIVTIERAEGTSDEWKISQRVALKDGTVTDCYLKAAAIYRYRAYAQNTDGDRSVDSDTVVTRTRAYIPGFAVLDLAENLADGGTFNPVATVENKTKSRLTPVGFSRLQDSGAAPVDLSAFYALGLSDVDSVLLNDGSPTNYLWRFGTDDCQKLTDTNFFPYGLTRSGVPVGSYFTRIAISPQNVVTQYHAGYWQDGFVDLTPDVEALRTPSNYPPPVTPYATFDCLADMNAHGATAGCASWVWLVCPDGQNSTIYFGPLQRATVWPGNNQPAVDFEALQHLNNESEFTAINDQGDMVGNSALDNPSRPDLRITHAVRSQLALAGTSSNKLTDLGTLGGLYSAAIALNNSGVAVGYSTVSPEDAITNTRAVYWLPAENWPRRLPGYAPDRLTYAWGINDSNRIVGDAIYTNETQLAVLWEPNPAATNQLDYDLVNLNELANSSSWHLRSARFINQHGLIVGSGLHLTQCQVGDGVWQTSLMNRPFLLIPNVSLAVDFNRDGKIELNEKDDLPGWPYQFWINDDSDDGDVSSDATAMSNVPGAQTGPLELDGRDPNYADDKVNGACDLPDWFPVYLNISNLLVVLPSSQYEYRLVQAEGALNFLYTDLRPEEAGHYLTNTLTSGFGPGFNQPVATATDVQRVTPDGVALSPEFLELAANQGRGVLLFEARQAATQPLRLEVWNSKRLVTALELPLRIGSVEDMYGWLNLRHVAGETRERLSNLGPPNWPAFAAVNKAFVFVHGYNVNEKQSRGWAAEMFKRLWWSGCQRRFYAVSWFGEDTQVGDIVTINFHTNVFHAFQTAPVLANFLNETLKGQDVTVMAHSLGNMITCSAIQDYGARPARYFMVNGAVAMEAFDGGLDKQPFMTHPDWKDYPDRLYASEWHTLFPDNDGRHGLTWRNRFQDVPKRTQLYNFYSSGEEALENRHDDSDPWLTDVISLQVQSPAGQLPVNWLPGRYAWVSQETLKGRITAREVAKEYLLSGTTEVGQLLNFVLALEGVRAGNLVGSQYGGWGFNSHWDISGSFQTVYIIGLPVCLYIPGDHLAPSQTIAISSDDLQVNPFFLQFLDTRLTTTEGSEIATNRAMRAQLLAEAIPSRTYATGANALIRKDLSLIPQANFNMNDVFHKRGWPKDRTEDSLKESRWLHSDLRDVAYPYSGMVFDKFVELEGEK